jgi:hypothetical protein
MARALPTHARAHNARTEWLTVAWLSARGLARGAPRGRSHVRSHATPRPVWSRAPCVHDGVAGVQVGTSRAAKDVGLPEEEVRSAPSRRRTFAREGNRCHVSPRVNPDLPPTAATLPAQPCPIARRCRL